MAVLGSLEVDGLVKVELSDNDTGSEVKVVVDDLDELIRGLGRGAVRVDVDGQGLGNTNGVRQLDEGTSGKLGVNKRLGDPSGKISSRSIDLGEILAREGTTTVGTPTAISIDDDLAAGQTGVTLGTTNDEKTRGLDLWSCQLLLGQSQMHVYLRGRRSCRQGTWRG